jgi:hypothetical protein
VFNSARGARYVLLLTAACATAGLGAELEGVRLDDRAVVSGQPLQLNGMGLRSQLLFRVYVAGLYLPEKTRSAREALAERKAKRMSLVMLRDISGEQFAAAIREGIAQNTTEAELAAMRPQVDALMAIIRRIGEAKKGMVIELDYVPNPGMTIRVDGEQQGRPIEGEILFRSLLRIWIGEHPIQQELKKALLGG